VAPGGGAVRTAMLRSTRFFYARRSGRRGSCFTPPDLPGLSLILGVVATDLAAERGGTELGGEGDADIGTRTKMFGLYNSKVVRWSK
jgi:hypothetical protein